MATNVADYYETLTQGNSSLCYLLHMQETQDSLRNLLFCGVFLITILGVFLFIFKYKYYTQYKTKSN